jgi:hypothetical protein
MCITVFINLISNKIYLYKLFKYNPKIKNNTIRLCKVFLQYIFGIYKEAISDERYCSVNV